MKIPIVKKYPTSNNKYYFDNNEVEDRMLKYKWTGCTDIALRDEIMKHTEELIRQVIRAHNLHRIYPGQEESAFMDLFQTGWMQLERVLYKYRARIHCGECYNPARPMDSCIYSPPKHEYEILMPEEVAKRKFKCPICNKYPDEIIYRGCSKIFNLWSQVARTVILAHIKREGRDRKNSDAYRDHLDGKWSPKGDDAVQRFLTESRNICKYNDNYLKIIDALEYIIETDNRPYEGIIGKLVKMSNQSRAQVSNFLKMIRLRSSDFTDSPRYSKMERIRSVAEEEEK